MHFSLSPDATSKMDSLDPQREERVYLCQHMFDILIFVWHLGAAVLLMGFKVQKLGAIFVITYRCISRIVAGKWRALLHNKVHLSVLLTNQLQGLPLF